MLSFESTLKTFFLKTFSRLFFSYFIKKHQNSQLLSHFAKKIHKKWGGDEWIESIFSSLLNESILTFIYFKKYKINGLLEVIFQPTIYAFKE